MDECQIEAVDNHIEAIISCLQVNLTNALLDFADDGGGPKEMRVFSVDDINDIKHNGVPKAQTQAVIRLLKNSSMGFAALTKALRLYRRSDLATKLEQESTAAACTGGSVSSVLPTAAETEALITKSDGVTPNQIKPRPLRIPRIDGFAAVAENLTPRTQSDRDTSNNSEQSERPLRILCIDGGGTRGVVAAEILRIMEEKCCEGKRLGDVFDLVVGTSVGAILGAGVTLIGLSPDQCTEFLKDIGPTIFTKKCCCIPCCRFVRGKPKYSENHVKNTLREALERQVKRKHGNWATKAKFCALAATHDRVEGKHTGRVLAFNVPVTNGEILPEHQLLFIAESGNEPVDLLMASTALPTIFSPQEIHYKWQQHLTSEQMIDGGVYANNPTQVALVIAKYLGRQIDFVVSVGCGHGVYQRGIIPHCLSNANTEALEAFMTSLTNTQTVHSHIAANTYRVNGLDYTAKEDGPGANYFRFEPELKGQLSFDEIKEAVLDKWVEEARTTITNPQGNEKLNLLKSRLLQA